MDQSVVDPPRRSIYLFQSSAMTGMKARLWCIDLLCFQWHPM